MPVAAFQLQPWKMSTDTATRSLGEIIPWEWLVSVDQTYSEGMKVLVFCEATTCLYAMPLNVCPPPAGLLPGRRPEIWLMGILRRTSSGKWITCHIVDGSSATLKMMHAWAISLQQTEFMLPGVLRGPLYHPILSLPSNVNSVYRGPMARQGSNWQGSPWEPQNQPW